MEWEKLVVKMRVGVNSGRGQDRALNDEVVGTNLEVGNGRRQ